MSRPHNIDRVSPAMHPIKYKIDAEQQQDKRPPIHLDGKKPVILPQVAVDNINARRDEHIHRLIADRGAKIGDRLGKRNVIAFVDEAQNDLEHDKEHRDRRQKCVDVGFLHRFGLSDKYTVKILDSQKTAVEHLFIGRFD